MLLNILREKLVETEKQIDQKQFDSVFSVAWKRSRNRQLFKAIAWPPAATLEDKSEFLAPFPSSQPVASDRKLILSRQINGKTSREIALFPLFLRFAFFHTSSIIWKMNDSMRISLLTLSVCECNSSFLLACAKSNLSLHSFFSFRFIQLFLRWH